MYSGTTKCCACKKPATENPRHEKDDVCFKCRDMINIAVSYKAQMVTEIAECIRIEMYPKYISDNQTGSGKAIFSLFNNVVKSMALNHRKIKGHIILGSTDGGRYKPTDIVVTEDQSQTISAFYNNIQDSLDNFFNAGKSQGANLLMQLHSGDLTLEAFNERLKKIR